MAIQFAPTDCHLTTTATNFLNRAEPLSILCWLNSTAWNSSTVSCMVGIYSPEITAIQIGCRGGAAIDIWNWGGENLISSYGLYQPVAATWIAVAYIWDGYSHLLYVQGELIATSTTEIIDGDITSLYINGFPTSTSSESSATRIDEVSYYNRALTQDEVKTITSLQSASNITNGLIAQYRFNELPIGATVSSVVDYSGNGNTLLLSGTSNQATYSNGISSGSIRPVLG